MTHKSWVSSRGIQPSRTLEVEKDRREMSKKNIFRAPYVRISADLCDVLHRGRGLGDEKLPYSGFPGVKQRVLASSRVLVPQILASMKVLLVLRGTIVNRTKYC